MESPKRRIPRRTIIPYAKYLKSYARRHRNGSTKAEVFLWLRLKGRQVKGYDFHRQKPLDQFIVDFFCHELMLVIEVDGGYHQFRQAEDRIRQNRLEAYGLHFLRFSNESIIHHMPKVMLQIVSWIDAHEGKIVPYDGRRPFGDI